MPSRTSEENIPSGLPSARCVRPECYRLRKRGVETCHLHAIAECPVCLEEVTLWHPRCGHGICEDCLSRLQKRACVMCRRDLEEEDLGSRADTLDYSAELARASSLEEDRRNLIIREWAKEESEEDLMTRVVFYLGHLGVPLTLGMSSRSKAAGGLSFFSEAVLSILYGLAEACSSDIGVVEEEE